MKLFIVRKYWNMDSEYVCCRAYMYICIWRCVWSCITQWRTWTLLFRLHFAEAFGSSQFRGKTLVRSCLYFYTFVFLNGLSHRWTTDCCRRKESLTWTVWGVFVVFFVTTEARCFYKFWFYFNKINNWCFSSSKFSFRFFAAIVEMRPFPSRSCRSFCTLNAYPSLSLSLRAYELSLCDLPLSRMNLVPLQISPLIFLLCSA